MATRQYYQVASEDESSTSSLTYQDKATLTFTPDANSTYLILASWAAKSSESGNECYTKLLDSTATADLSVQVYDPASTTSYAPGGCAVTAEFGAEPASQTYKVQYKSETNTKTA